MKGTFEIIHCEVRYSLEGYEDKFYVEDMSEDASEGFFPEFYMYLVGNKGECVLISEIDLEDALNKALNKYKENIK